MPETTTERGVTLPCRGFGNLLCPKCNCEAAMAVHLDDCASFYCPECEESVELADVQALLDSAAQWRRVLQWLNTASAKE